MLLYVVINLFNLLSSPQFNINFTKPVYLIFIVLIYLKIIL